MIIRKISIGPDLKSAMNYSVGQAFNIIEGDSKEEVIICLIILNKQNKEYIDIYVKKTKTDEVYVWKSIKKSTPHTFEYDLNF